MNFKIEKLPKSKINIIIVIEAEEIKKYADKAIMNLASHVNIKGFRPGKAPKDMIIQHIGQEHINEKTIDVAINDSYGKIIIDNKIPATIIFLWVSIPIFSIYGCLESSTLEILLSKQYKCVKIYLIKNF